MKYSEVEKQIKVLSSKYNVNMIDGDFSVNYKNMLVAWVKSDKRYLFYNDADRFNKLPFSNKLYMILSELAMTPLNERVEEKKYYVKAFDGSTGYLNIICEQHSPLGYEGQAFIDSGDECFSVKTRFTDKEIEQLKKRDDIPLDWNKVALEEAE